MNKHLLLTLLLVTSHNYSNAKNAYEVLNINPVDATAKSVQRECRRLRATHHPDKGGASDDYILINEACEFLLDHDPSVCTILEEPCVCLNGTQGICGLKVNRMIRDQFANVTFLCKCTPNPDGCTRMSQPCFTRNKEEGRCMYDLLSDELFCRSNDSIKKEQQPGYFTSMREEEKPEEPLHEEPLHKDGCTQKGDPCTCSNTNWQGSCTKDPFDADSVLFCKCEAPKQEEKEEEPHQEPTKEPEPTREENFDADTKSTNNNTNTTDEKANTDNTSNTKKDDDEFFDYDKFFETVKNNFKEYEEFPKDPKKLEYDKDIYIYSRSIQSAVYSLPLERSLTPFFGYTADECHSLFFALAPFVKTGHTSFSNETCSFYEKRNGGVLVKGRYSFKNVWIDVAAAFEKMHTKMKSKSKFTGLKALDSNGVSCSDVLITLGAESWFTQELYTNLKLLVGLPNDLHDKFVLPIGILSHHSVGLQSDLFYTFHENDQAQCNFITNFRWLHFGKREAHLYLKDLADDKTVNNGNCVIKPGNFFDLLVATDCKFGCEQQHQAELGYDATWNAGERITIVNQNKDMPMHVHFINPASHALHTLYGSYTYTFAFGCTPLSVGLGASATFTSRENTKGLIWGLVSMQF